MATPARGGARRAVVRSRGAMPAFNTMEAPDVAPPPKVGRLCPARGTRCTPTRLEGAHCTEPQAGHGPTPRLGLQRAFPSPAVGVPPGLGAGRGPRKAIICRPHLGVRGELALLEKRACQSQALPWPGSTRALVQGIQLSSHKTKIPPHLCPGQLIQRAFITVISLWAKSLILRAHQCDGVIVLQERCLMLNCQHPPIQLAPPSQAA